MQALGPGAFGKILDDSGREAAGNAQRAGDLRGGQTQCRPHPGRCAQCANHRGGMKTRAVNGPGGYQRHTAHQLDPDGNPLEHVAAGTCVFFTGGENRRHDHSAGVHRCALEGVVIVLTVGGGTVDERGFRGARRGGMTDHRAGARILTGLA